MGTDKFYLVINTFTDCAFLVNGTEVPDFACKQIMEVIEHDTEADPIVFGDEIISNNTIDSIRCKIGEFEPKNFVTEILPGIFVCESGSSGVVQLLYPGPPFEMKFFRWPEEMPEAKEAEKVRKSYCQVRFLFERFREKTRIEGDYTYKIVLFLCYPIISFLLFSLHISGLSDRFSIR